MVHWRSLREKIDPYIYVLGQFPIRMLDFAVLSVLSGQLYKLLTPTGLKSKFNSSCSIPSLNEENSFFPFKAVTVLLCGEENAFEQPLMMALLDLKHVWQIWFEALEECVLDSIWSSASRLLKIPLSPEVFPRKKAHWWGYKERLAVTSRCPPVILLFQIFRTTIRRTKGKVSVRAASRDGSN